MSVFDVKESLAFAWDAAGAVRAVRVRREPDGRLHLLATATAADGSLAANLAAVREQIQPQEGELILGGGNLAGLVCFEHDFPRMASGELPQAVGFELPRRVPLAPEELHFGWRILPAAPGIAEGNMRVRVAAIPVRDWDQLLGEIAASGWRMDVLLSPWLAIDPLLSELPEVSLPGMDEGFGFRREPDASGGRRVMVAAAPAVSDPAEVLGMLGYNVTELPSEMSREQLDRWLPVCLLAAYGLSPAASRDRAGMLPLPHELQPVRFRTQRTIFMGIAALVVILVLAYLGRLSAEARGEYRALSRERRETLLQIQEFDQRNRAMEPVDSVICELAKVENGIGEMLYCLHQLTTRIPQTMSLFQLNSRGNLIELNLRMTGDGDDKLAELEAAGCFTVSNRQTRRNPDGTANVFLRLTYRSPSRPERSAR